MTVPASTRMFAIITFVIYSVLCVVIGNLANRQAAKKAAGFGKNYFAGFEATLYAVRTPGRRIHDRRQFRQRWYLPLQPWTGTFLGPDVAGSHCYIFLQRTDRRQLGQ